MMTIRQRLTLWFTGLVALIIGVSAFIGWIGFRKTIYNLAVNDLKDKQNEVHLLFEALTHELPGQPAWDRSNDYFSRLKQILGNEHTLFYDQIFFQMTDNKQHIIIKSKNLGSTLLPLPENPDIENIEKILLSPQVDKPAVPILYATSVFKVSGFENWTLQIGLSLGKAQKLSWELMIYELLAFILAIFLALILGRWLAKKAIQPMQEITHQVKQMTGQDLFSELNLSSLPADEIGLLAETFDDLLRRISKVFQAQQQFVSNVSHEFNTPLTVIRGHAQILKKRAENNPALIPKSTKTIIRECDHLTHMVDDLLFLSRLESHIKKNTEINLVHVLEEIYEGLKPLYPNIQFKSNYDCLMISGDYSSLRRLFLNLLENAVKATSPEDPILITVQSQKNSALIQVIDSGCGIDKKHLPYLFKRFYRVDYARSRKEGGSGIGLSLVSEIIKAHHGTITVDSKEDQGSSFNVFLPLIQM